MRNSTQKVVSVVSRPQQDGVNDASHEAVHAWYQDRVAIIIFLFHKYSEIEAGCFISSREICERSRTWCRSNTKFSRVCIVSDVDWSQFRIIIHPHGYYCPPDQIYIIHRRYWCPDTNTDDNGVNRGLVSTTYLVTCNARFLTWHIRIKND